MTRLLSITRSSLIDRLPRSTSVSTRSLMPSPVPLSPEHGPAHFIPGRQRTADRRVDSSVASSCRRSPGGASHRGRPARAASRCRPCLLARRPVANRPPLTMANLRYGPVAPCLTLAASGPGGRPHRRALLRWREAGAGGLGAGLHRPVAQALKTAVKIPKRQGQGFALLDSYAPGRLPQRRRLTRLAACCWASSMASR